MSKFGDNLNIVLKLKGIQQKDFAEMTCTKDATISRYIKGHIEPSMEKLIAFAKVLDVTIDYLVGIDPANNPQVDYIKGQIADHQRKVEELQKELDRIICDGETDGTD